MEKYLKDHKVIVVLAQMNTHIWYNETKVRNGEKGGNLHLTHGLNGIRNVAGNKIAEVLVVEKITKQIV